VSLVFRPYVETQAVDVSSDVDDNDNDDADVSLCVSCREGGLLVVYQSQWQRRLLARYGSMCLLNATYKTTRYSLLLFFLCTY